MLGTSMRLLNETIYIFKSYHRQPSFLFYSFKYVQTHHQPYRHRVIFITLNILHIYLSMGIGIDINTEWIKVEYLHVYLKGIQLVFHGVHEFVQYVETVESRLITTIEIFL